MTTEDEVITAVIDPMAALFGRPYGCKTEEDVGTAQAQYVEALAPFSIGALERAWAEVRSTWRKTTWPPVAVIVDEARLATKAVSRAKEQDKPPEITWPKAVSWLWKTDNGRLAVERDVCEEFCYRAIQLQGVPPREEVLNMVHEPCGITDNELEALESGGPLKRTVAKLGRALQTKNADLREKALKQIMGEA